MALVACLGLISWGCSPPRSSNVVDVDAVGSTTEGTTTGAEDVGQVFTADGQGGTSELGVFMGDAGLLTGNVFALPAILPSQTAQEIIRVQIANLGGGDLTVTQAGLMIENPDGSAPNKFLSLVWKNVDPDKDFPFTLKPHALDNTAVLEADLYFQPLGVDSNAGTLGIQTDNPLVGTRKILLKPPSYAPDIRLAPAEGVFWYADLGTPETLEFQIHNDGLGGLEVTGALFDGKASTFQLVEDAVVGTVKPKGAPGYAPLTFHVTYQPVFGSSDDAVNLLIASNDPDQAGYPLSLTGKYETNPESSPCVWQLPGPGETLDFSDTLTGTKVHTLMLKNVGQDVCTVTGVAATGDPNGHHYGFKGTIPGNAEADPPVPDIPVELYPVGVAPGKQFKLEVVYSAGDAGFDTPIVVNFQDPLPRQLDLEAVGGPNKPCLALGPMADGEVVPLQFVAPPANGQTRQLYVKSCGDGTLTIETAQIIDSVTPGNPSVYWSVNSPPPDNVKIGPGQEQPFQLAMTLPNEEGAEITGELQLNWRTGTGMETTVVPMEAFASSEWVLPTAHPGLPENYADAVMGEALLLDAGESAPGVDGQMLDSAGYLWFVVQKPAESAVSVKEEWGGPTRFVIPDAPGTYRFGLMVRTNDAVPLVSNLVTIDITVAAPPEPVP